jgi:hypothetical protein
MLELRQAELQVAGARAALALDEPEDALAMSAAALALDPPPALRAQALLVKSAAQLAKGDSALAALALADGLATKDWKKMPAAIRAEYAERRAHIAVADKRSAEAVWLLDEAAALWKQAGRLPEMARALAAAGRLAKESGDGAGACDRFYRSSRSLWAQGYQPEAVKILEEGVACAENLKDETLGKRLADLFVTFKNGQRLTE